MDHFFTSSPATEDGALIRSLQPQWHSGDFPKTPYGFEDFDGSHTNKGILDYWYILVHHKVAITVCAFIGLILGFAAGLPKKPIYRAGTQLEILNLNEDFMNMKRADPLTTNNASGETSEQQTQAKLLESNALIERVFTKLDPRDHLPWAKPHKATSGWRSWFQLSEPAKLNRLQNLLNGAAANLKIRTAGKTRIIEITTDSPDAQLAATFLNTLTQEYMQQTIEDRWNTIQKTSEWLGREIDAARSKLQHSEDALQDYAHQSGLIFTSDSKSVATEKLQQAQRDLANATTDRILKQSRYETARSSQPDTLADVLGDPSLQGAAARLNDARRQLANLSAVYDPQFSKVRRIQAEIDDLQRDVDRDRENILKRIENDYQEAGRRESLLLSAYNAQIQEVLGQGQKEIQYNILKREVDSNRQVYDTMLQQMKQSSISSALRASTVRVIDPASVPDWPISPNFKLNMVLGMGAGIFLSAILVILRDVSNRTLQHPGEAKLWTDLPELGTIPTAVIEKKMIRSRGWLPGLSRASSGKSGISLPAASVRPVELISTAQNPLSISEAFRSTLASILFVGGTSRPRVLVFTSSQPSEGKTTVVSNLGITIAEIHQKVLIIDADLRRPRVHSLFKLPNDQGLSSLLRNDVPQRPIESLIQETAIPGLHVLPAGPPTDEAGHLLYSPTLRTLIGQLRKEYDMILVDTPPMLQMADARLAGRLADAVILVARARQTRRESVIAARERFAEDRTLVLGTILNDWNPRLARKTPGSLQRSYYRMDRQYGSDPAYSAGFHQ